MNTTYIEQLAMDEAAERNAEHCLDLRVPTAEERESDRSTVLGTFVYPVRAEYGEDGGDYADDCAECEAEVRGETVMFLNDHGIDTTNIEVRLSEQSVGEIRVYW